MGGPVLVVGATGTLGGAVVRALLAQGQTVRALCRRSASPERVAALRGQGVGVALGDLTDAASLAAACRGVQAVVTTAASTLTHRPGETLESVDLAGPVRLLRAAAAAEVERFVYTSFTGRSDVDFPLQRAKRAVEERIRESRVPYTILRPSFFMETFLSADVGFDPASGKVRVFGTGHERVSWVAVRDVAALAVMALGSEAGRDVVLPIGGPSAPTPLEVVRMAEARLGRTITVEHVGEEALQAQMAAAPDDYLRSYAGLALCQARGDVIDMGPVLATWPVPLTSVGTYLDEVLPG